MAELGPCSSTTITIIEKRNKEKLDAENKYMLLKQKLIKLTLIKKILLCVINFIDL